MKIRSITCFCNPYIHRQPLIPAILRDLNQNLRGAFEQANFEVQTTRLATVPFKDYFYQKNIDECIACALSLEKQAHEMEFDYLCLGPLTPITEQVVEIIPSILAATKDVFLSAVIAKHGLPINLEIINNTAKIIKANAIISADGFENLRFAALANVQAFTPFFPAAFSEGNALAFSLAMECADEAIDAFQQTSDAEEALQILLNHLESTAQTLQSIAEKVGGKYKAIFKGFDFSLAPFPKDECSLGKALEMLAPEKLGYSGSLFASALLAGALDRGKWKKAGFNGLMLPVLEDSILAQRTKEGTLDIYDLLMYSAVCGTGLDTIPLAGDIKVEDLQSLLLDIAALALRLDKPLTARLMPIPGKQAGDETQFQFDYFANGKVLSYKASTLSGLLKSSKAVHIYKRK